MYLFGLINALITCFPVQRHTGFKIVGGGRFINSSASQNHDRTFVNSYRFRKMSREVNKKDVVKKSCISATIGSPLLGVTIFCVTPIKWSVSLRASKVWGTWMFISSPSKSALKGAQTHSLNLRVFPGATLTLNPIILILCKLGCLLNMTTSPSRRCLSTISPNFSWILALLEPMMSFYPFLVMMKLAPPTSFPF